MDRVEEGPFIWDLSRKLHEYYHESSMGRRTPISCQLNCCSGWQPKPQWRLGCCLPEMQVVPSDAYNYATCICISRTLATASPDLLVSAFISEINSIYSKFALLSPLLMLCLSIFSPDAQVLGFSHMTTEPSWVCFYLWFLNKGNV